MKKVELKDEEALNTIEHYLFEQIIPYAKIILIKIQLNHDPVKL